MKKLFFTLAIISLFSCTSDDVNENVQQSTITSKTEQPAPEFIEAGDEVTFGEYEQNDSSLDRTINIHIMCNYFSPHTGTSYGYGQSYNGDYYFYWTEGNPRKYKAKKVNAPHCL